MKKLKYVLLCMFLLLLTGCSGVYNIEIYNNRYKEDITIVEENSKNWYDTNENGVTFKQLLDEEYERDNHYYKKKLISDFDKMGLNYKSDFDFESYSSLGIVYRCYQHFRVLQEENVITIITSDRNKCYDYYKWLDDITINVKTNHKVLDHNADETDKNTYTWYLNRNNALEKSIVIQLSSNEFVFNYENEEIKKYGIYIGIIAIIGIIILGIGIFLKLRNKKVNKI
ncbi:MAG TPA: hypothetical protein GXZ95_05250 [Mollicutes bacterium]|nr:hypothetical protein [Mollicutes bacterium]